MPSIRQRGNSYQITVSNGRDINGKQIIETATFTPDPNKTKKQNEKALKRFADNFEEQVKEGKLLSGKKLTFRKYIDIWLTEYAQKQYEPTTLELSQRILATVFIPTMGHLKLSDIKPLHLQRLYDDLQESGINGKPYTTATLQRYHNILSSCFSCAVDWRLIEDNPCRRVKLPKKPTNPVTKNFTLEEAQAFLSFLDETYIVPHGGRGEKAKSLYDEKKVPLQFKTLFYIALYGGLRRGELLALTWNDIDFEHNCIEINKSLAKTKSDGVIVKSTKNKSSNRIISMPYICMDMLHKLKLQQMEKRLQLGTAWKGNNNIFYQENGYYMDLGTPNKDFQRIINRYNKTHADKLPLITFHGLRHTSATLLISQNNDIKTVSKRLGHAKVSTTLDIYSHSLKKKDEEASASLEILFK